MKCFHLKHFLLIMVPLLFLISPLPPSADSEEKKAKETDGAPIVIESESLEMNDQQQIVIFKGNVNAKEKDFVINCEKMVLYYKDQSNKQASETGQFNIEKIIALKPDLVLASNLARPKQWTWLPADRSRSEPCARLHLFSG